MASFFTILDSDSAAVECFSTDVGKQWTVPLHDGSLIKLNTDTRLCLRHDGANLYATLYHGEALFTMRPPQNSHRRLIVSAGDLDIIDVATIFSVRISDHGAVNVAVEEGAVQLSSANFSQQELRENQLAEVGERGTALPVIRDVPPKSIRRTLAWRDGVLMFEKERLANVAQEFNRYNRTKIELSDHTLDDVLISGVFTPTNLFAFAASVPDFHIRWKSARDQDGAPMLLFSPETPPTLSKPAPPHHRSDTTPHTR
jgi:transmembrane sensor